MLSPTQILLVKTSSLGDVIHNLPVASDLCARFPEARIDWVVEEAFADIPRLHPGVRQVLPVALRRWKKRLLSPATWREISAARRLLAATEYDVVLDTQGLVKSALIARQARGSRLGYNADSAREPWAAHAYDVVFPVPKTLHAVERNRQLAAAALGYEPRPEVDYGLAPAHSENSHSVVFLTATSRDDKLWPEADWANLGRALAARGLSLLLPGGNSDERERAARIARHIPNAQVVPPMRLADLATLLMHARFAVGVDTGLAHLAAAVRTPVLALYTATDPGLTGVLGGGWFRNLGGKGNPPTMREALTALMPLLPASHARTNGGGCDGARCETLFQ
jgi:heptosyltransferase-1